MTRRIIKMVTPSLAIGSTDSSLFTKVSTPVLAVKVIEDGGRALVPDAATAREVLGLLDIADKNWLMDAAMPVEVLA